MKHSYDFIAIGDNTTDAFIRLGDDGALVDQEKNLICMKFKDKIPYESVTVVPAVGNSANAAMSATRLGLKTAFISDIGDDDWGKEFLAVLKKEGVSFSFITTHKGMKTNYHYVLWFHDDRTILVKHEEYDYKLSDFGSPKWVYFSSMGGNSLPFHKELESYLESHPGVKLAFQPGTYQMRFGKDELSGLYRKAEVSLCNKEEAQRILETDENDIKKLLEMFAGIGPRIAVITDGKQGAYVYDTVSSPKTMWLMPPYPDPKPPLDRTGAGDAFSSTFVVALALGMDIPSALRWAPINSMSVVQYVGAREGLLAREKLEEYLNQAPENYKPEKI